MCAYMWVSECVGACGHVYYVGVHACTCVTCGHVWYIVWAHLLFVGMHAVLYVWVVVLYTHVYACSIV